VVFFQDTYQLNIGHIFVAGLPESGGAAPALRAQTSAQVSDLVSASQLGGSVGFDSQVENGGASWGPCFPDMRVDINLATHPYEDSGTSMAALGRAPWRR
jgi:hypothetical protein